MRSTNFNAKLLREYGGLPAGTVGDVLDVIQGDSYLVKFPGRGEPVLVWHEAAELIRKP